ncbi:MAG: HAD-IC family P-type ATPase [Oscillospiraceae bacterium]|nr:HAD-IC family P-type ATPase [Oscillospiraceae bacterium]
MGFKNVVEIFTKHSHSCSCENCDVYGSRESGGSPGGFRPFDVYTVCRLAAAVIPFAAGLIVNIPEKTETILMIIAAAVAGYDVLTGAIVNLIKRGALDENLLMSIASIAAFAIGQGHEGAAVMILFQTGELFREYAVRKANKSIAVLSGRRAHDAAEHAESRERASGGPGKAETEKFITGFARTYTPAVLALAVVMALLSVTVFNLPFAEGIERSLVFLVVACPCALVISIPLTYFAGMGGASKAGILFKNSAVMDSAAKANAVAFDKSVVLSGNKLRVSSVKSDSLEAEMLLKIAAHTEAHSGHAIARAIKSAYDGPIFAEATTGFREFPGAGVTVKMNGTDIFIGSREFISTTTSEMPAEEAADLSVFMSVGGKYVGRITLAETLEAGAPDAIKEISEAGCRYIAMFSSDDSEADRLIAGKIGAVEFFPGCLPQDKADKIRELKEREKKGGRFIFAGRGGGNIPALAEADVGIGFIGADDGGATEAADIVITDNNPAKIATVVRLSKNTRAIIIQNVCFVLAVKAAVLILGVFGISPLWFAVFADVGVTLPAVLNSMRAFLVKNPGHGAGL